MAVLERLGFNMSLKEDLATQKDTIKTIKAEGRKIYVRSFTESGEAWNPVQVATDTETYGVFTSYKNSEIDGTLITTKDKKILMYLEPDKAHKIVDGGVVYSVINVDVVQPAETKLLFKVQVRI